MTDNTPAPQVWPTLRVRDARALIRFLVEVIGFEETVVYDDWVDHAELSWPAGGGIRLGSARDSVEDERAEDQWVLRPGSFGAYVVTGDPDSIHARASAAGAEIVRPPQDTDYGSGEFALRDPEGNHWFFVSYRGHPARRSSTN